MTGSAAERGGDGSRGTTTTTTTTTTTMSGRRRRRPRPAPSKLSLSLSLSLSLLLPSPMPWAWRFAVASSSSSTSTGPGIVVAVPVPRRGGGDTRTLDETTTPSPYPGPSPDPTIDDRASHNECGIFGNALHPGESLSRGQFLCYGDLRFGIDAERGRLVVGFNDVDDPVDDHHRVTPTLTAWIAIPTSLFTPPYREFERVDLSSDGNLLGYDVSGLEIYDSNYDYDSRLDGKASNSILFFSQFCYEVGRVSGEGGENCAELRSPPMPGHPYGMVTWSVHVVPEDIVEVEPLPPPTTSPSPSSASSSSSSPILPSDGSNGPTATSGPTESPRPSAPTLRPSAPNGDNAASDAAVGGVADGYPPAISPSRTPTSRNLFLGSEVEDGPVAEPVESAGEYEYVSKFIIWGTVWLDSNRNGAMDLGEGMVDDFEVRLYECSDADSRDDDDDDDDGSATRRRAKDDEGVAYTNADGMYVFEVPIGRTYRVQFDVDHEVYGYSSGIDTSTNMLGWTDCETFISNIQWDAGLYLMDDPEYDAGMPEMAPAVTPTANYGLSAANASIGGFVYLDVDEDGIMDPNERTAAVGGYTVNDASILVSITDCNADEVVENEVVETLVMKFPGTYSFGDLSEGFYKLRYEMQVTDRLDNTGVPLYSFIDSNESTFYETKCGKLGKGETINSGNVGLRMEPLEVTAYSAPSIDPAMGENATFEDASQRTVASVGEGADSKAEGGINSFASAMVAILVTVSLVVAGAIIFAKRRNLDLSTFPFVGSGKSDREDIRSAGSSRVGDSSLVSAALSIRQAAAESLIVETGKAYSNVGGNDSDGSDIEKESYGGLEFSLKKGWIRGNPSEIVIGEIHEADSEGYEVYDDEEGSEQSAVDYGPVVSKIIAKYSEKLSQTQINAHYQEEESAIYSSNIVNARNYQYETDSTQSYYTGSSRSSDPPAASYKDIPAANVGWDGDLQHAEPHHQYPMPNQYPTVCDSYQYATTKDEYSARHGDGGFDSPSPTRNSSSVSDAKAAQRAQSNPRGGRRSLTGKHQLAIPESSTMEYNSCTISKQTIREYDDKNDSGVTAAAHEVEDNKSVVSSGSDQSADPPGASYKTISKFPPPPLPRKTTPPPPRRTTPNTSPNPRRSISAPRTSIRGFSSPPPRGLPSPPPPRR